MKTFYLGIGRIERVSKSETVEGVVGLGGSLPGESETSSVSLQLLPDSGLTGDTDPRYSQLGSGTTGNTLVSRLHGLHSFTPVLVARDPIGLTGFTRPTNLQE